jgi:hypothetical protein
MSAKDEIARIKASEDSDELGRVWLAMEELAAQIDKLRDDAPASTEKTINDMLRGRR